MRAGWDNFLVKLKSASEIIAGQSPEGKYYNDENEGLPFYQGKKLFGEKYLGEPTTWTTKVTKEAKKDDILMSVRAPVGPVNFAVENICIGRGLAAIRANDNLNKEYLFYFLLKHEAEIESNEGAVFNSINKTQIGNISIPIPPISEQKQIVSILDKAFEAIDKAKANIEKNIQNAEELFQSKLNEIFSQKGEGWEEKKLAEMSKIMYGYTAKAKESGEYKYLRITDIQNKNVSWENVPEVNVSSDEAEKYILQEGDIVFARTGATTGKSYLITQTPNAVFASYLIRVQCESEILSPQFLYLFFQSGIYWEIVNSGISGSAQGGFNASKLSEMKIHFPVLLQKQKDYVDEISNLEKLTNSMTEGMLKKMEILEELKKSILQKAFNGELTKDFQYELEEELQMVAEPESNFKTK